MEQNIGTNNGLDIDSITNDEAKYMSAIKNKLPDDFDSHLALWSHIKRIVPNSDTVLFYQFEVKKNMGAHIETVSYEINRLWLKEQVLNEIQPLLEITLDDWRLIRSNLPFINLDHPIYEKLHKALKIAATIDKES